VALCNYRIGKLQFLIEYDGRQHFEPVAEFGGKDGLQKTQENDQIKNNFAKKYDFILIRISYTVDNISLFLAQQLNKYLDNKLSSFLLTNLPDNQQKSIVITRPRNWSQLSFPLE